MSLDTCIAEQRVSLNAAEHHERVLLDIAADAQKRWMKAKEQREEAFTQYGKLLEERKRREDETP